MAINFSAINYSISAVSSISSGAHLDEATIRKLKALGIDPSKVQSKQQAETLIKQAEEQQKAQAASSNQQVSQIGSYDAQMQSVREKGAKLTLDIKDLAGKVGVTLSPTDSMKVSLEKIEAKIKEITSNKNASKTDLSSTQKVNATPEELHFKLQELKTRCQELESANSSMYVGQDMMAMLNRMSLGI